MSMPNIPNIPHLPDIDKEAALSLIIVSIALEEIGLSHIINAEGEKIQKGLHLSHCIDDLIAVNDSVSDTLKQVIKKEILLDMKLEAALDALKHHKPKHDKYDKHDKCHY